MDPVPSRNVKSGSVNDFVPDPSESGEELSISIKTSDAPTNVVSLDKSWIRMGTTSINSLSIVVSALTLRKYQNRAYLAAKTGTHASKHLNAASRSFCVESGCKSAAFIVFVTMEAASNSVCFICILSQDAKFSSNKHVDKRKR